MSDIFISYSHSDTDRLLVEALFDWLGELHYDAWYDKKLIAGERR